MWDAFLQFLDYDRVLQSVLQFTQFICRVEDISKTKVGDDDISIAIQKQILQLQVTMHDSLLVQIAHTRYKLSK
jgi:hypothetical protein